MIKHHFITCDMWNEEVTCEIHATWLFSHLGDTCCLKKNASNHERLLILFDQSR